MTIWRSGLLPVPSLLCPRSPWKVMQTTRRTPIRVPMPRNLAVDTSTRPLRAVSDTICRRKRYKRLPRRRQDHPSLGLGSRCRLRCVNSISISLLSCLEVNARLQANHTGLRGLNVGSCALADRDSKPRISLHRSDVCTSAARILALDRTRQTQTPLGPA